MALNRGFTAPIVMALGEWKSEAMIRRYAAVTERRDATPRGRGGEWREPHVNHVACYKPADQHSERGAEIWARRSADLKLT
jgi:hypothetical protein